MKGVSENLQALGVVLFPEDDQPVLLCALDWAELSNTEYDHWKMLLAEATGTQPERMAIQKTAESVRKSLEQKHPVSEVRECLSRSRGTVKAKSRAALILAYQQRCQAGLPITISALHLGGEIVAVHTPGKSFIEYQLLAQDLRPDAMAVVTSYGDCGPGYVTFAKSFAEGGYEPKDSFCLAESESILRDAIAAVIAP